jgi:hypothetical protein
MDDDLIIEKEDPGIFETEEMRTNPEKFKDQLIDGFKKNCSESMLKSFLNDDDIWDYITQQGIWEPDKKLKPSRGIMIVGNGGGGVSELAKLLAENGLKGVEVVQAGDKILDSNGKFIMVDSIARFTPELPELPPRPMFEEYDGRPRNREERRRGRRI